MFGVAQRAGVINGNLRHAFLNVSDRTPATIVAIASCRVRPSIGHDRLTS